MRNEKAGMDQAGVGHQVMDRVMGFAGPSGSGKTTLIEALLPVFAARGLRVNVIKHSHHDVTLEPPGKDSARFRHAGAQEVMIASPHRFAIVHELRAAPEPSLAQQLARLAAADLTLVEGYKLADIPRIEVCRPALRLPMLHPGVDGFVAIAADEHVATPLPVLNLNAPEEVASFVCAHLALPCLNHEHADCIPCQSRG